MRDLSAMTAGIRQPQDFVPPLTRLLIRTVVSVPQSQLGRSRDTAPCLPRQRDHGPRLRVRHRQPPESVTCRHELRWLSSLTAAGLSAADQCADGDRDDFSAIAAARGRPVYLPASELFPDFRVQSPLGVRIWSPADTNRVAGFPEGFIVNLRR